MRGSFTTFTGQAKKSLYKGMITGKKGTGKEIRQREAIIVYTFIRTVPGVLKKW
jgi:hypothetical protein